MATQDQNENPYKTPPGLPTFSESRGFEGVDHYHNAQDLTGGFLLQADNFVNVAGQLYVRPGEQGQLTSPVASSSSVDLCLLTDASGNYWSVYLNTTASGGRIWAMKIGASSASEILDENNAHYNFNSATVQCQVFGTYAYICDGVHKWRRFNLNGGFPLYAMTAPVNAPTPTLTNNLFDTFANSGYASNWTCDGQNTADANLISGNFRNSGFWTISNEQGPNLGGYPNAVNLISSSVNICIAANAGGSGATGGTVAVPQITASDFANQIPLYPSRFHLLAQFWKNNFGGSPNTYQASVIVTGYSDNGITVVGQQIVPVNVTQQASTWIDTIIDFSGAGPVVAYLKFQIVNTWSNSVGNLYVVTASLTPMTTKTQIIGNTTTGIVKIIPTELGAANSCSSSSISSSLSSSSSSSGGYVAGFSPTDLGNVLDYQQISLKYLMPGSASVNLTQVDRLAIGLQGATSWINLQFQLYLTYTTGNPVLANNGTSFSSDLSLIYCDISTLTTAQRTNVTGFLLQFQYNPTFDAPYLALQLGPLYEPGNLSVGVANYTYYSTEKIFIDYTDAIESNPSAPSQPVTPSLGFAQVGVLIPANSPYNSVSGSNFPNQEAAYDFYRQGGEWPDIRLIATVLQGYSTSASTLTFTDLVVDAANNLKVTSVSHSFVAGDVGTMIWVTSGTGFNSGTTPFGIVSVSGGAAILTASPELVNSTGGNWTTVDPSNPYYVWNATTHVLTDNTPDTWLTLANLMSFSRNPMPTTPNSIGISQGRIWASVGNLLYSSWLYNTDNSAPMMTTLVPNLSDPNYPVAGIWFPVSADGSDTIVNMESYGTPVAAGQQFGGGLLVFNKRSVCMVQGTDASDFAVREYDYQLGVGLVAMRGFARINADEVIFMGPDRLHVFPPKYDNPEKDLGLAIQPDLYPVLPNTTQVQSAFAEIVHGLP